MKFLGEYKELEKKNNNYPSLKDNVSAIPIKNKNQILSYLRNEQFIKGAMPALRHDCFTNEVIPGDCLAYTDGEYFWDYETIYYFENYNMNLPDDFIARVMSTQ